MKKTIKLHRLVGDFAENKDVARKIRLEDVMPTLSKDGEVVFDFQGVGGATQSFIHALISDPLREFHSTAFEKLSYKNANQEIRAVISIVYRYMQESLES